MNKTGLMPAVPWLPVLFACLYLFSPGGAFAGDAPEGLPAVSVTPGEIPLGGMALLDIALPAGARQPGVSFLGKEVPVFSAGRPGRFQAVVGAPLKTRPGVHVLSIRWEEGGRRHTRACPVPVKYRSFPEERLKVDRKMVEFPPEILRRVRQDQAAVRAACEHVTARRYWVRPFVWPVRSRVLSPFGLRRIFNGQPRSPHSGVDLRAPAGTPVKAANRGRVTLVRNCYLSGWTVVLDHGYGLFSLYAHLSRVEVRRGDLVSRGQVIGLSGCTGRATGPHLHWGVSLLGARLDPQQFMSILGKDAREGAGG